MNNPKQYTPDGGTMLLGGGIEIDLSTVPASRAGDARRSIPLPPQVRNVKRIPATCRHCWDAPASSPHPFCGRCLDDMEFAEHAERLAERRRQAELRCVSRQMSRSENTEECAAFALLFWTFAGPAFTPWAVYFCALLAIGLVWFAAHSVSRASAATPRQRAKVERREGQ